jgi:ectoine hydroxylase-related dioxygenase (phytanoyl-CoA dioxygenase family)
MLTAWLPLAPILPKMGPITVVRNTAPKTWLELPQNWKPQNHQLVAAPVQPGDAALFCWHTVHGNPPNFSQRPRRALALHFAIDFLEYHPHGKFRHSNERVVHRRNRLPDFQDERVCPLLWFKQ